MSEVTFSFDNKVDFDGLKGTLKISIPSDELKKRVDAKIREVAQKASISGFRPGKVPANVIRSRYLPSILQEEGVAMADEAYNQVMTEGQYSLAADPDIDLKPQPLHIDQSIDMEVKFEVIPEFELADLSKVKCEQPVINYTAAKVKELVDASLKSHPKWEAVERSTQAEDRITINFDGFLDGQPFEGGAAKDHEMVLGDGKMLEEFEANLIDKKAGEEFEFPLTFPEDYVAKDLAGKQVSFKVTILKIESPTLMKVGKPFYKELGLDVSTKEQFEQHLQAEESKSHAGMLDEAFKKQIYDAVSDASPQFDLPGKMMIAEAKRLDIDLDSAETKDREKVNSNVRISLILQKIIKAQNIVCEQEDILAYIKSMAPEYLDPEMFVNWYAKDRSRIEQAQFMVLENKVFEFLKTQVSSQEKKMSVEAIGELIK